jgi:hypothetical protein
MQDQTFNSPLSKSKRETISFRVKPKSSAGHPTKINLSMLGMRCLPPEKMGKVQKRT